VNQGLVPRNPRRSDGACHAAGGRSAGRRAPPEAEQPSGNTILRGAACSPSRSQIGLAFGEACDRVLGWNPETRSSSTSGQSFAEHVHDRHQPVETGVALQRDALMSAPAWRASFARSRSATAPPPSPTGASVTNLCPRSVGCTDAVAHHRQAVVRFQGLQLMRKSRLGQVHALCSARTVPASASAISVRRWRTSSMYESCS